MTPQPKVARRTFFATLGLAAAAGIATKLSATPAVPQISEPPSPGPKGGGYHLSEHVKKYYRTTTI